MPRARKEPLFELGGQWIAREGTSPFYHRFWTDARAGRTRRQSLGTSDLEEAKRKLAEIVVKGAPKTERALLAAVLLTYFEERTDKQAGKKPARAAGRMLVCFFGETARVGQITEAEQKRFAEAGAAKGHALSYISRNLSVLAAAYRHSKIALPVFYHGETIRDRWSLKVKAARKRFVPSDDQLAAFLSLPMPEDFWRWLVVSCLTGARPEAALDLTPEQRIRDAGLLELNPEGRAQNKKFRPTVREPRALTAWLDHWESEDDRIAEHAGPATGDCNMDRVHDRMGSARHKYLATLEGAEAAQVYCRYKSVESVQTAIERLRPKAELPKLSAYSIRHKVASVLRSARIPEDEIGRWLGHRRAGTRVTAGYGEYSPDYLKPAADALDIWWTELQRKTSRSLWPPTKASNVVRLRA